MRVMHMQAIIHLLKTLFNDDQSINQSDNDNPHTPSALFAIVYSVTWHARTPSRLLSPKPKQRPLPSRIGPPLCVCQFTTPTFYLLLRLLLFFHFRLCCDFGGLSSR